MKRSSAHGILLSCAILSAFALASCSGILGGGDDDDDGGTLTNTVLPNTVMVTVPASLVGDSGAGGSLRALRSSRAVETDRAEEAYWMIKSGVFMMKSYGASTAMYGAVIDELISQSNLQPTDPAAATVHSDEEMTLTQALVDKMNAFAASSGFEMDGPPPVDTPLTVPPFSYETSSAPYSYSLRMTETDVDGTFFTGFYWSSDKTKVKMVMSDNESEASDTYRYTVTYDDTTKTSAMVMDDDTFGDFTFSIREDTASAKNGAYVFFEASDSFDSDGDLIDEEWNQSGTGYADDDGGTLKVTIKTGTGLTAMVETYETAFNAADIDATKDGLYDDAYAEIDESMYDDVGGAAELSGEDTAYSMETRVYPLTGVTVDTDYNDANDSFYVIFDERLTINGDGTLIDGDDNVDFSVTLPDNINTAVFVGSGYGSAADELTVFLDVATAPPTGYVYVIQSDGITSLLNYVGSVTL